MCLAQVRRVALNSPLQRPAPSDSVSSSLWPCVVTRTRYSSAYHDAGVAWGDVGALPGTLALSLLWLAGYAVVFFGLAT